MKHSYLLPILASITILHFTAHAAESSYHLTDQEQKELDAKLVKAAIDQNIDAMKSYLDQGANPNAIEAKQTQGTLLMRLCRTYPRTGGDYSNEIKLLLAANADPNLQDSVGNNPLLDAAFVGNYAAMQLLFDANVKVNITNKYGQTALVKAAKRWQEVYAKNADEKDKYIITLSLLLNHGADIYNNGTIISSLYPAINEIPEYKSIKAMATFEQGWHHHTVPPHINMLPAEVIEMMKEYVATPGGHN